MRKRALVLLAWLSLGAPARGSSGEASASVEAARPQLAGTWVLDAEASDSLEPILRARGVSWWVRRAADQLTVTQVIAQQGDLLTIDARSAFSAQHYDLVVDGVERESTLADGTPARMVHRWDEGVLHSVSWDGGAETHIRRRLVEDDVLKQVIELRLDGEVLEVERVFRRAVTD